MERKKLERGGEEASVVLLLARAKEVLFLKDDHLPALM